MGYEERFPPTRLSAGCGFRNETITGMRRNGRDAPIAVVRAASEDALNRIPIPISLSCASDPRFNREERGSATCAVGG